MLQANSRDLGQHANGRWRTDWHYRTNHSLEQILEIGDKYWAQCVHLLRAGDLIIVEDVALCWQYVVSVRHVDVRSQTIIVKMLHGNQMANGVTIFDAEAMGEAAAKLQKIKAEEEERAKQKADFEEKYDHEEAKPQVVYKGKNKQYTIFGYDMIIKDGFPTKEAASAALEDGSLKDQIEVSRLAYIDRVSRNG